MSEILQRARELLENAGYRIIAPDDWSKVAEPATDDIQNALQLLALLRLDLPDIISATTEGTFIGIKNLLYHAQAKLARRSNESD